MDWVEVNIGAIGEIITGNTPLTSDREFYGGPYPFIKPTDMDVDRRHVDSWEETYSEKAFNKYRNAFIPEGATGVVTIGTVGEKLFQADQPCFTNQSVNVIVPYKNKFDNDFVYYLMKYNLPQVSAANPGTASGRHHVSKSNFSAIKVKVPAERKDQRRIASILSAFDDLIENNLKRIRLLEELARRTYEEWFITFRARGKQLQVNRKTGLPEGWRRCKLPSIADFLFGYPFKANDFNNKRVGTPIIRIRNIPSSSTNDYTTQKVDPKYLINKGDILVGMDGEFHMNIWSGPRAYLVQRSCRISPKNALYQGFLAQALIAPIKYYEATISGATVAHLGKKHLDEIELIVPPTKLKEPLNYLNTINQQRLNLAMQNFLLKESRDILLPRLMNGAIKVP